MSTEHLSHIAVFFYGLNHCLGMTLHRDNQPFTTYTTQREIFKIHVLRCYVLLADDYLAIIRLLYNKLFNIPYFPSRILDNVFTNSKSKGSMPL